MHNPNAQMHAADVAINCAVAILLALIESHKQLDPDVTEELMYQIHSHLCDACGALEPQNASVNAPSCDLDEHVCALTSLAGMVKGVINNRLSACDESHDADYHLWSLMGFLNKNILSEIKKFN